MRLMSAAPSSSALQPFWPLAFASWVGGLIAGLVVFTLIHALPTWMAPVLVGGFAAAISIPVAIAARQPAWKVAVVGIAAPCTCAVFLVVAFYVAIMLAGGGG